MSIFLLNATPRGSECRFSWEVLSVHSIGGTLFPSGGAMNSVIVSVTSSVRKSVVSLPPISVIISVTGSVRNSVVGRARNSVIISVTDSVRNSVTNSVRNSVRKNVKDLV